MSLHPNPNPDPNLNPIPSHRERNIHITGCSRDQNILLPIGELESLKILRSRTCLQKVLKNLGERFSESGKSGAGVTQQRHSSVGVVTQRCDFKT